MAGTPQSPLEDATLRVPITEHFNEILKRDERHARELRRTDLHHASELRQLQKEAVEAALAAAEKAVETAKIASDEHLKQNNNVLDGWREDRGSFVTRDEMEARSQVIDQRREEDREQDDERFKRIETFQSKMLGGLGVIALIGLGNLVKLWLS